MTISFSRRKRILELVPRFPQKLSARAILNKLVAEDINYSCTMRTMERGLADLCETEGMEHDGKMPRGYFWPADSGHMPKGAKMDLETAVTFRLVEGFLKPLLPASVLKQLDVYFREAKDKINTAPEGGLKNWDRRVCIEPRSLEPSLRSASPEIHSTITRALLNGQVLEMSYKKYDGEKRDHVVVPYGLLIKGGVFYFLAKIWGEKGHDPLLFAMHRIKSLVEVYGKYERPPREFDVRQFSKEGKFQIAPAGNELFEVEVRLNRSAGRSLLDAPVGKNTELVH